MRNKYVYKITFYNIPDEVDDKEPILFSLKSYIEKTMRKAGFRHAKAHIFEAWSE